MAKYRTKETVDIELYKPGMEDGFIQDCLRTCMLKRIAGEDVCEKCPDKRLKAYIKNNNDDGSFSIKVLEGDYIITDSEGYRDVHTKTYVDELYEKVED